MVQADPESPWQRRILHKDSLCLTRPIHAFGPLVVGVGITVLVRLFMEQHYSDRLWVLEQLRRGFVEGPALMALFWILPVLLGALISCTRTFSVQIAPGGLAVHRTLGTTRFYQPSEVVTWGFEHGPGMHSNLPPTEGRTSVRFLLGTADGYYFSMPVKGQIASSLCGLLSGNGYGKGV